MLAVPGQTPVQVSIEPSYDVVLDLIVGSNGTAKGEAVPPALSSVSRRISNSFSFTNYRLANTFLGRVGNGGVLEYKTVSDMFGGSEGGAMPSFLDWRLDRLQRAPAAAAAPRALQVDSFRFGARVPVRSAPGANYEQIGLTLNRLTLVEDEPALIGTLLLPGSGGTAFVVLTVRQSPK
jgi:hypothetical protein